ncbi:hypothetical protein VOLCADRAFT_117040, partial [Volvox carteri f. nagariensis]
MDWDDAGNTGTAKRPVKQTLQSKKQVPAKVQVKLPKALFESAVQSGNSLLVERSLKQEANKPPPGSLPAAFKLPQRASPPGAPNISPRGSTSPKGAPGSPTSPSNGATAAATAANGTNGITPSAPPSPPPPATLQPFTRRPPRCEYFFDPATASDLFPPRPLEGSALADYFIMGSEAAAAAAAGDAAASAAGVAEVQSEPAHPLGWVPVEETQFSTRLRPRTGQLPVRTTTSMPLEYFDSPEMELISPEQRLEAAAAGGPAAGGKGPDGVLAYSRYFDSKGSFSWAPCFVREYD